MKYFKKKRCHYAAPGWWCSREPSHSGPCAARPKWYNIKGWIIMYKN